MSEQKIYYTIIPTQVYDSPNTDAAPVGEFDADTDLHVLETNLGSKSEMSKVKLVTGPETEYYVRTYFLFNEDEAHDLIAVPARQNIDLAKTQERKIKDAKVGVPYLENGKYHIVIDTGLTNTQEVEDTLDTLKYHALVDILEYYGKVATNQLANKIANSTNNIIEVSDFHYSVRPGQNIKVRFSVSVNYLRVFANQNMDDFALENIHRNFISINILVSELDKTINSLSNIVLEYDKQLAGFSGEIEGLDFKKMSKDIRKFLTDFKKYLRENGVIVSSTNQNKLEIGFDIETFELSYVLHYDPYGKFLRIGTNIFCKLVNIKIAKMLINYKNILSSSTAGLSWMDFINEYFAGEFKLNFNKISQLGSTAKKSLSNLKDNLDNLKADFEDLSLMIPSDVSGLSLLKGDEKFRETASELLLRSKDVVGDSFLIELPNILANIEDLESLYTLVFDKVSIKDLADTMMENIGKNMNLPDLNEIKIRGILKKISLEELPNICMELIDLPEFRFEDLAEMILDDYEFSIEEFEAFLDIFGDLTEEFGIEPYFIHKTVTGEFGGLLVECFEQLGEELSLEITLETDGISVDYSNLNLLEYYQPSSVSCMLRKILTNIKGIPDFNQIMFKGVVESLQAYHLSELIPYAFEFFGKLDKKQLSIGLEKYIKELFKNSLNSTELMSSLLSISKIKVELDKINLTKDKFLNKASGLNLDLEIKKIDANFSMPSIKSVNPSFDFSKFQFGNMGDIFGSAISSIEDTIVSGIETGLVAAFKGMLGSVLDSITNNTPDINSLDFGALNLNDVMDAMNGFGSEMLANLAALKINFAIEIRNSRIKKDCDEGIPVVPLTNEEVKISFDDMSRALKPMELTRILKGQYNSRDYENMTAAIQNEELKNLMSEDLFNEVIDIAVDYVDLNLLEELEKAYGTEEVMVSVCENAGIPYKRRKIRDDLKNKYDDLSDEQLDDLIDSIVEDVKDSMADAIGNMKDNFEDNLPFDENPCSFMPKPSDIPAMNFIDDMIFDTIFDPIELEYKAEATTVPDLLMSAGESDKYVPLFYYSTDSVADGYEEDENGLPVLKFKPAFEIENWDEISDGGRIYNEEFSNHYIGRGTKFYSLENNRFIPLSDEEVEELGFKKKINTDEWELAEDEQVYVKKQDKPLTPMPELKSYLLNPKFSLGYAPTSEIVSFRLDYLGKLEDSGFSLFFEPIRNKIENIIIDPNNVNIDCVEKSEEIEEFDIKRKGLLEDVNDFILEQYDKSGLQNFTVLKNDLETIINKNMTTSQSATVVDSNRSQYNGLDKRSDPISLNIVGSIFEQIATVMSKTDLFNTSDMLSFIFDSEDVNLFKVQDAKNESKDDYKGKCSFTEEDNQLQDSSIKKLTYLMIRIFIIEEVIRGCFVYDTLYDTEASDSYCSGIYNSIEAELKGYPNAFYEDVFKKKYQEAYGATFDNNDTFRQIVKDIYSDIALNFEEIYRNASSSLSSAFLDTCVRMPDALQIEASIPTLIKKSYIDYFENSDKYISDDTINEVRTRFIIQRALRRPNGTEIPIGDANALSDEGKVITKLCFVMEINNIAQYQFNPMVNNYTNESAVKDSQIINNVYPGGAFFISRMKKSTSYVVKVSSGSNHRHFLLLPVAIHEREYDTKFNISGYNEVFQDFIENTCRGSTMKRFLSDSIQARMLLEKPEISKMFLDTKTAIRKAIESLSNDSYDRQELETKMVQLEQASEASTSPDFSPKASKMALMTVPMIIKGFAEMFDPNTKIASGIRKGFDLTGIDIPPPVASLMALPINVIPFAPGPPITPLGLLYLATSFLEPKERKRLSDLKRGKNLNKGANQETGTFLEGTLEEQAAAQAEQTVEFARDIVERYEKIKEVMYKMCRLIVDEMNELHHAGDKNIYIGMHGETGGDIYKDNNLKVKNFITQTEFLSLLDTAMYSRAHYFDFHLSTTEQEDKHESIGNTISSQALQVEPFRGTNLKNRMENQSIPASKDEDIESMIAFIMNFWILNANIGTTTAGIETHNNSLISAIIELVDWMKSENFNDINGTNSIDVVFKYDFGKNLRNLIQHLGLSIQKLRAGMMYTIYAIDKLLPEEFQHGISESYAFNNANLGVNTNSYKTLFDPANNNVSSEFDQFVDISEQWFNNSSSPNSMYIFMPSAPGSTNYNTQFKNMKADIFKRSKFNDLFDYSSSKSQEFFSIFGNEDIVSEGGIDPYNQSKGYSGNSLKGKISQNLQDFKDEYDRAKQAIERLEE